MNYVTCKFKSHIMHIHAINIPSAFVYKTSEKVDVKIIHWCKLFRNTINPKPLYKLITFYEKGFKLHFKLFFITSEYHNLI